MSFKIGVVTDKISQDLIDAVEITGLYHQSVGGGVCAKVCWFVWPGYVSICQTEAAQMEAR